MINYDKSAVFASLDKALEVIEYLDNSPKDASIYEISQGTGINKSTVYRILNTLSIRGYAYQNPETKRYALSLGFYHIGIRTRNKSSDAQLISPYIPELEKLREKYDENINIATLDFSYKKRMRVINILSIKTSYLLNRDLRVLDSMEAHTSASGKAILSYARQDYINTIKGMKLEGLTPYSITDWDKLEQELAIIRDRGYSVCFNEHEIGISCVAVPIFSPDNTVKAAMSLSGSTERIQKKISDEMINDLKFMAKNISRSF